MLPSNVCFGVGSITPPFFCIGLPAAISQVYDEHGVESRKVLDSSPSALKPPSPLTPKPINAKV